MIRDEQIIERVLKGNVEDYQELVRRYQDGLFRLAYRLTNRRENAEDAVIEAFETAYCKLGDCRDRGKFGAWLRKITVNICYRRFTHDLPLCETEQLEDMSFLDDNPVEFEVLRRAQAKEIQEAVAKLPPFYRTVVVLRYLEEMELKEIAELLGEQAGALYTRLHRAKKMLAKLLEVVNNEMC